MGIVYDSEMYRATEKQFAHYPMPAYPDQWETWFTTGCYDNGYYSSVLWATNGPVIMVDLHIIDPSGNSVVDSMQFFQPEEYEASTESLNIRMGKNFYRGTYPEYHLSVHDGNNGIELDYEALIQPTMSELPDGIGIGRISTPFTPVFISWFFRPLNKITGKLLVGGKEIPVTGRGWADHQYGNVDYFKDAVNYGYWGCFQLGKHTITIYDILLSDKGGYRPIKWLWDWKGEKLYEYSRNCDFYIEASDIEEGGTVPRKLEFVFEHDRIRGIITCKYKMLMQKQVLELEDRTVTINRSVYDCHAMMEIDNEKINTTFSQIIEATYGQTVHVDEEVADTTINENTLKKTASRLSIESKLKDVLNDLEGKAILERFIPGISTNKQTKLGYGMTLKTIFSMKQANVSKAKLAAIDEELRGLE